MPRPICIDCLIELKTEVFNVIVAEMFGDPEEVYKYWHADLWKCPGCGRRNVFGYGLKPLAEHFQVDRMAAATKEWERQKAEGHAFVCHERAEKKE